MADDTTDTAPPLTVHKAFPAPAPAAPPVVYAGRNWIRTCSLTVGDAAGKSLDLSGFRVRFETISATIQTPSSANIIISNVSRELFNKVKNEFTQIPLACGYASAAQPGVIFSGTITEVQYGLKENWTDPLLVIWAKDGDRPYNQARLNQTLAAGWTPQSLVDISLQAMKPFGITMGQVLNVDLSTPKFPRGSPFSGMVRDYLREIALTKQASWNLNGGRLNFVHKNAVTPSSGVVLNSKTGMLGQPVQKTSGIDVRCLINSAITVDSNVRINQKALLRTQ